MKLDIIVPHYKEPWTVCRYLFDSIAMQDLVDWKDVHVIVVNDGDECVLDPALWEQYPYDVEYAIEPHRGVSAARNTGIDMSEADYVMFCDADDGFCSNLAVYFIQNEAKQNHPDMISAEFFEEVKNPDGDDVVLALHDKDVTFVHGKVYRREFLVERNIRFPDGHNLHEDGYFNSLAIIEADDRAKGIPMPLYLWRWNPTSVVRKENFDFTFRTYPDLVKSWILLIDELAKRGFDNERKAIICKTMLGAYYDFQIDSRLESKNAKYLRIAEKAAHDYYELVKKDFTGIGAKKVGEFAIPCREIARQNGMIMEHTDLKSWIKHIEYDIK